MSDCPGALRGGRESGSTIALHCPRCTENAHLRAHLAQRTAALQLAVVRLKEIAAHYGTNADDWKILHSIANEADRALADLPDAPEVNP